jgi:transcriptional regulator with GAF, ATPase, and Fis domain
MEKISQKKMNILIRKNSKRSLNDRTSLKKVNVLFEINEELSMKQRFYHSVKKVENKLAHHSKMQKTKIISIKSLNLEGRCIQRKRIAFNVFINKKN